MHLSKFSIDHGPKTDIKRNAQKITTTQIAVSNTLIIIFLNLSFTILFCVIDTQQK